MLEDIVPLNHEENADFFKKNEFNLQGKLIS